MSTGQSTSSAAAAAAAAVPHNAEADGRGRRIAESLTICAFVVGTASVAFVAFSNTITWYSEKVWGATGDFWQGRWLNVMQLFGNNEFYAGFYGTYLVFLACFWLYNIPLMLLDWTKCPQFLHRYKIQPTAEIKRDTFVKCVRRVLFNQLLSIPFFLLWHYTRELRGCDAWTELPNFTRLMLELVVCLLVEEIGFYYTHRMVHAPALYKRVHKIHHEWTAPIGIVCIYAHPFEHIVSNLTPVGLGPIVCGSHLSVVWIWTAIALLGTTLSHSGYHFPFLPSSEFHDYHHFKFNNCFGVLGVMDRLHGTDTQFRTSVAYKRHYLMLNTAPVRDVVPDADGAKGKGKGKQ